MNQKLIVITFDDGYLDTYTHAFPILQRFDFSANVFLVANLIGKKKNWGSGQNSELMNWNQIREMLKYKISFQSHTNNHTDLTTKTPKEIENELVHSKKSIEDALGTDVSHLAYPYGRYNQTVVQITKDSGYTSAYTDERSDMNRYCCERFEISLRDGMKLFSLKINPWCSWIRRIWNGIVGSGRLGI